MRLAVLLLKSIPANAMSWFGLDIGGTLTKFVFFETKSLPTAEDGKVRQLQRYLTENHNFGKCGFRDAHLQFDNVELGQHCGSLHFIRFQTGDLNSFFSDIMQRGLTQLMQTICATGGGAHKFENELRKQFGMELVKLDEFDTLIRGILFAELQQCKECYYLSTTQQTNHSDDATTIERHSFDFSDPYPFILVNVGSGVSILDVRGPQEYKRVSGSSLGGATFLGLCSLLTGTMCYEEAIALATQGDHRKVDKLVRDIYGGNYERFNLSGNLVAASFGHMYSEQRRAGVSRADLARATLVTITNNIGAIAQMCALNRQVDKVAFVGNFLRINPISMELLAHAMDYWSDGAMKAIFLKHEGYFGALGCLLSNHVQGER